MQLQNPKRAVMFFLLGGVALWLLLDWAIVTDKERIERAVRAMRDAAASADAAALFEHVSPAYYDERLSAAQLRLLADDFFRASGPMTIRIRKLAVEISGETAVAEVSMLAYGADDNSSNATGTAAFLLDFRKEGRRWLVTQIVPLRVNGQEIDGWGTLMKIGRF